MLETQHITFVLNYEPISLRKFPPAILVRPRLAGGNFLHETLNFMRLLIVTQKIDENDAVLGFMHGWLAEFARQAESVMAVCLEKGQVSLPDNVSVFSLGKERNAPCSMFHVPFFHRLLYTFRFLKYAISARSEYDAVFVHMNPEYVLIAGWFWKLWGKTVTLWYAHKSVPWHLRLALFFTDIVFTSTPSGFRLPSGKVRVVGQGIDTERFNMEHGTRNIREEKFRIISVGRIAPAKDCETLIGAAEILKRRTGAPFRVDIVGPTSVPSDKQYLERLKRVVAEKNLTDTIFFHAPVANKDLPQTLAAADLFVNMSHTGSMDKAVPEAMAVGLPVLTCNEAFKSVLGPFTEALMYSKGDAGALADKLQRLIRLGGEERRKLGTALRDIVVQGHSLKAFVGKIITAIEEYEHK